MLWMIFYFFLFFNKTTQYYRLSNQIQVRYNQTNSLFIPLFSKVYTVTPKRDPGSGGADTKLEYTFCNCRCQRVYLSRVCDSPNMTISEILWHWMKAMWLRLNLNVTRIFREETRGRHHSVLGAEPKWSPISALKGRINVGNFNSNIVAGELQTNIRRSPLNLNLVKWRNPNWNSKLRRGALGCPTDLVDGLFKDGEKTKAYDIEE